MVLVCHPFKNVTLTLVLISKLFRFFYSLLHEHKLFGVGITTSDKNHKHRGAWCFSWLGNYLLVLAQVMILGL